jgi:opacity protein-like surface antigen
MKIRIILGVCTGALLIGAGAANAADPLVPPPPPIQTYPETSSCIYVRGDVGIGVYERPDFVKNQPAPPVNALGEDTDNTIVADIGVGCQFTENLRADVTLGYRSKAKVEDDFNSLDAKFSALTVMVNAYYDIGNFNGFTPYVGAGIGLSRNKISDINLPATSTSGTKTSFAYSLQAGVSYDYSEALAIDASYRYIDLGKGQSGPATIDIDKLVSHDFRIGLRYRFLD